MKKLLLLATLLTSLALVACDDDSPDTEVVQVVTDPSMNLDVDYSDYLDGDYESLSSSDSLYITLGGTYVLEGSYSEQIIIDADGEDIQLVLINATITSDSGPAILVLDASDVTISVPEGTTSTISDSSNHPFSGDEDYNAAIYSYSDLIFNGEGTLYVNGLYNNAISSKDDIKMVELTVYITSVDDGIIGRDYLAIDGATLIMDVQGDGLLSTNDETSDEGFIYIVSGTIHITASQDGIQAVNYVMIDGGTITIEADDDGIQATTLIEINGGELQINATNDAINSSHSILITGGDITIFAGDDAIHADETIQIDGGTIDINNSYEGIEAYTIIINGGTIDLYSSDDGINGTVGGGQEHGTAYESTGGYVEINGGTTTINSIGDGLDCNGTVLMTGGTLIIYGPTTDAQAAIDFDEEFTVTGGTIVAFSSNGMVLALSESSTQASFLYSMNTSFSSGTTVTLTNSSNEVLVEATAKKGYEAITISTPELTVDNSYTLSMGTTLVTITMEDIITIIGSEGMEPGGTIMPPRR